MTPDLLGLSKLSSAKYWTIVLNMIFLKQIFFKSLTNRLVRDKFFLFIYIFIYRWYTKVAVAHKFQQQKYTKVAEANKFQQKSIFNYINNKLNIVVKLVYLQIKYPQSIFPCFLILVLNSKTELLDLSLAGRLFHIREPLK